MKKENRVKTVFFGIWVIIALLLIQIVASAACAIPVGIKAFYESGADMTKYMEVYTSMALESDLVTVASFIATCISAVVGGLWYYFGYYKPKKAAGKTENAFSKLKNLYSVLYILFGAVSTYSLAVLIQMGVSSLMPKANEFFQSAMAMTVGGNEVISWLLLVLVAPINEEIAVRGIIVERGKRSFGIVGIIILSSLLFGLYHMNPIQGLYVLPMGVFWAYLAVKYNSVVIPIFGHIMNNAIGGFVGSKIDMENDWWILLIVFVVTFAVCFTCAKKNPVLKVSTSNKEDVAGNAAEDAVEAKSSENISEV